MVYCAGKLIENLKLSYKSNKRYFLWVYCVITHLGSRVLPTFRVDYHTGKPIERVVYFLMQSASARVVFLLLNKGMRNITFEARFLWFMANIERGMLYFKGASCCL